MNNQTEIPPEILNAAVELYLFYGFARHLQQTDEQIVFAIAQFTGFHADFRKCPDCNGQPVLYVDADRAIIPDYVWILGRHHAEELLESLQTVQRFSWAETGEIEWRKVKKMEAKNDQK